MKRFLSVYLVAAAMIIAGENAKAQTYTQVWADEFNGSIGPDWVFETGGGGWGNGELQYYQSANASISNNNLVITAKKQSVGGMSYTSARMKTQGKKSWKFGKVEASIKVPSVQGLWPAFWMLGDNISSVGWPSCGEIDIMEQVNTSTVNYGTIHWNSNGHVSYGGNVNTSGGTYHNYSIIWTTSAIKWYVDGAQYLEANIANGINNTGCFQNNFFILLNMAVGGQWPGNTIGALPASYNVDYVRVSQAGSTPTTFYSKIEAESYSSMLGVQTETCSEGGQNVGWIDATDWMSYNVNLPYSGTYTVKYRVASPNSTGKLILSKNATDVNVITVPNTGGWQNWTTVSQNVNLSAGAQSLALYASVGGFNVNWWSIEWGANGTKSAKVEEDATAVENSSVNSVRAFPNPVSRLLTVEIPNNNINSTLTLLDLSGRVVDNLKLQAGQNSTDIDMSSVKSGIYMLKISNGINDQMIKVIKK